MQKSLENILSGKPPQASITLSAAAAAGWERDRGKCVAEQQRGMRLLCRTSSSLHFRVSSVTVRRDDAMVLDWCWHNAVRQLRSCRHFRMQVRHLCRSNLERMGAEATRREMPLRSYARRTQVRQICGYHDAHFLLHLRPVDG